jgi:hypothetical protein
MPPHQDIEFIIELLHGTPSILGRPYRMPMNKLVELMGSSCSVGGEERQDPTDVCGLPFFEQDHH